MTTDAFFDNLRGASLGMALCWKIAPAGLPPMLFTNHDQDITVGADTFTPSTSFGGSAVSRREGMSVDNLSISALVSTDIPENDLLSGKYDAAAITLYLVQWTDPSAGLMVIKRGHLGEIASTQGAFETEMRGLSEALQRRQGETYGLQCSAKFGDSKCGLDIALYTHNTTLLSWDDNRTIAIGTAEAEGYFQYGTVTFTSGNNMGREYRIAGHVKRDGTDWLVLQEALPIRPQTGDTLVAVRGCNKSTTFCKIVANFINYRGFPFIPTEAEAMRTPNVR